MIRILLDFSRIQSQLEKFVWFAVDTLTLLTIKCVKNSVCDKFNLTDIQLYIKEGLLRDEDTIFLLKDEDTVRVVQKKEETPESSIISFALSHKKKKRHHDCSLNISTEDKREELAMYNPSFSQKSQTKETQKKRKRRRKNESDPEMAVLLNTEMHSDIESGKLSSKCTEKSQIEHASSPLPNSEIKIATSKKQSFPDEIDERFCEVAMPSIAQNVAEQPTINFEKPGHQKRIRKRRRRNRKSNTSITTPSEFLDSSRDNDIVKKVETSLKSVPVNGLSDNMIANNGMKNKHIKFAESSDDSDSDDENAEASVVEFSSLFEMKDNGSTSQPAPYVPCKPGPYSLEQIKNTESKNCNLDASNSLSKLFQKSVKYSPRPLSSTPTPQIDAKETKKKENLESDRYTPLYVRPAVGAHIAFKMLELNEMYTPVLSDFKEGIVKSIDTSENIEIELSREEVKAPRLGKFEVVYENDSEPESEVIKMVTVNWNDMSEPQTIISA